jgi:hypothetical protein
MSGALVDSWLKASVQPPIFSLSTFDVVGEMTLDESSWRSNM